MMLGTDHTPRGRQTGSILIMTLVVLVGIGTITAGLMTILQQRAVTLTEDIRMLRGLGVADSYRLALIAGRDDAQVQTDLGEALPGDAFVESDGTTYTGAIEAAANRWGYRFIYDPGGTSPGGDRDTVTNRQISGNATESFTNTDLINLAVSGNATLTVTPNTTVVMTDPALSGNVDIIVESGATLELTNPAISGNVTFDIKEGANVCIKGDSDINGNAVSGLTNTECSGSGNDLWTFRLAN